MYRGSVLPLKPMDCIIPGRPSIWSPCKWVMNIFLIFIGLNLRQDICLWVPSPQSNKKTSPNAFNAIEA